MTDTLPNLWPDAFKVNVQTPLTILRAQASFLSKVTRGILQGVVETESGKDVVQHRLVVVAPAYNGYRHNLVTVKHHSHLLYPAEIIADGLAVSVERNGGIGLGGLKYSDTVYPKAASDDEMQRFVQQALQSSQTKAVILSLIAKSNEANSPTAAIPQNGAADQEDSSNRPDRKGE